MRVHTFPNGGGVIHRVYCHLAKGHLSVWVDPDGTPREMEQILPNRQTRPVKRNGPIWNTVSQLIRPNWGSLKRRR